MGLNKSSGNMYGFVTHTWNAIKGECPHGCQYCYMSKRGKLNPDRLDEKELKTDLGSGNTIFVGSSCDMWAEEIPTDWIVKVMFHLMAYPDNTYFFQSKNPSRFIEMMSIIDFRDIGFDVVFCTTIETNRVYPEMGNTCSPVIRSIFMGQIAKHFKTHLTIEPVMDFDLNDFLSIIYKCNPSQINIGADSKRCNLPEPTADKLEQLIFALSTITEVHEKPNLKRLLK